MYRQLYIHKHICTFAAYMYVYANLIFGAEWRLLWESQVKSKLNLQLFVLRSFSTLNSGTLNMSEQFFLWKIKIFFLKKMLRPRWIWIWEQGIMNLVLLLYSLWRWNMVMFMEATMPFTFGYRAADLSLRCVSFEKVEMDQLFGTQLWIA